MGRASETLRRRLIGMLVVAVAAAAMAGWAVPAQAKSPRAAGKNIPAVGHPRVVQFNFKATAQAKAPAKTHGKPFLSINPSALAKAKRRAATINPARAAAPKPAAAAPKAAAAAPRTGIFNGIDSPGISAAEIGFCCTPPDSTGSVGPSNYVEFVNTEIRVYDRTLKQLSQLDMSSFVAAPSGHNVSDPQIQWDPRAGRWFYLAIAFATHNNYLVFGWSKTADPSNLSGGWCRFGAFTGNQLADYPKLGHDDNFLLFGANLYDDTTGNFVFSTANIWALPKPAGGTITTCSASGLTAFADPQHVLRNTDGTSAFTPVPANNSDASASGYIVGAHSPLPPRTGDPLGPQTKVMLWHTTKQGSVPKLTADGDLTVGSFDVPAAAPQPGGPTLDTLDARLTQAVAHADPDAGGAEAVWTQHAIAGPGGRSVARWYEILPATRTLRQQGVVQSATDFIWNSSISPSIAGNDAVIFYNRGGASQLVLAAAQSRLSATPLGTMSSEAVLATSAAADVDFSCSSPYGPPCRWGDYSGASPDPLNAGVIWGSNQVNGTSVFGNPQWATQNYAVSTSGTPPPPPTPCTSLTWNAPSPASPQAPGVSVTLSAGSAGCPKPVYQFWIQPPGGTWTILQAYSSSASVVWNTTGQPAGTYLFDAWAKQSGSTADWEAHVTPTNPTYTLQAPSVACTAVTWNAPSPASPQAPGTGITFSGSATGCPNPVYQFWILPPGGSWTVLQAYSSSSSVTWNTTGFATGTYQLDLWAKQSGSTASWEAHVTPTNPTYTLQAPPPPTTCTAVTWNAPSPASPQSPGAAVTFSGSATGCPNPVYQFWIQPPGGAWTILQAYSPTASVVWNTTGQPAGTYLLDLWAKQSGSTASWEAHVTPSNPTYTLQAPPPPPTACTAVTWNIPNPASPQSPGASVTFSGSATGCPNPVYQFWILPPGGVWTILQAYSSTSSVTWNTTGFATGTYLLDLWAKQSGSTASWEAHVTPTNPTYTLQTGAPCTAATFTAAPASPQASGTQIKLTGTASGCPNPVYQFWIQAPGGAWTILQAYSPTDNVTWNTTGLPAGTYLFDVWVKQSGSSADWEAHVSPNPTFTIGP